jgi:hypothetical protein
MAVRKLRKVNELDIAEKKAEHLMKNVISCPVTSRHGDERR